MEDIQRDHRADLHTLKVKVRYLEARAEDAKNYNRRNNLKVQRARTILPSPKICYNRSYLGLNFAPYFKVERAHCMPTAPPCTFIFKLLNFRDQDFMVREARNQGNLLYENAKAKLCPKGLKYSLLFSAKQRV